MDPEEREELKKQMLASLEETKRLVAETRQMADEMEAKRLRIVTSSPTSASSSESPSTSMSPLRERGTSLAEMRAYIDKVKKDIEVQRKYNTLPWWKRLFRNPPPRLAG